MGNLSLVSTKSELNSILYATMTTSQPNDLLQFARTGNPKAIAALINHQLRPKGMSVKTSLKEGCLQVIIESAEVPEQHALVAFIRKGITGLSTQSINKVKVYGWQKGDEFPAWSSEFELVARDVTPNNELLLSSHSEKSPLIQDPYSTDDLNGKAMRGQQPRLPTEKVSSSSSASSPSKIQVYTSPKTSQSSAYINKIITLKEQILSDSWNVKKIIFLSGCVLFLGLASTLSWTAYTTSKVPGVVGQDASYAMGILKGQGFEVETVEKIEDGVQPGQVLNQEPTAESREKKGGTIKLIVAKPPVYSIQGSLTLIDSDISGTDSYCYGTGGYEDIKAAMPVTIRDAKGSIIATGTTEAGVHPTDAQYSSVQCTFRFKVDNVAKSDFYEIEVGRRGKLNYSLEAMKQRNWEVSLSLQ